MRRGREFALPWGSMKRERIHLIPIREDVRIRGDKRNAPRASCFLRVEWFDRGTGQTVAGTVLDISQDGMRIRLFEPTRLGQLVNIRFYVLVGKEMLVLFGAFVRQIDERELGIEFSFKGKILKDRVQGEVEAAAHRNLRFEVRTSVVYDPDAQDETSRHAKARSNRKQGRGVHESLDNIPLMHRSRLEKWIERRVATHL